VDEPRTIVKGLPVGFVDAVKSCLRQYATFSGRARRSEYWFFRLFYALVFIALFIVLLVVAGVAGGIAGATGSDSVGAGGGIAIVLVYILVLVVALALLIPSLAVEARRLHDVGRSAWWLLLTFVPAGNIVLLVFALLDSIPGQNAFGPNPKGIGGYPSYPQNPGQPGGPGQYGQPGQF
jgi:uncharacterized membrane protein YhaH (DUF805 family)